MNVRIIPEDEVNDGFILKPLFEAMLKYLGKPDARVSEGPPAQSNRLGGGETMDANPTNPR